MKLTLYEDMSIGGGGGMPEARRVIQYEARGFPEEKIVISDMSIEGGPERWRTRRGDSSWEGDYATPEEAVAALEREGPKG